MEPVALKPSVARLSPAAWSRVERDVFASLDARAPMLASAGAHRWVWLTLPIAVSAAAAIAMVHARPAPPAETAWSRIVAAAASTPIAFGDAAVTLDARSAVVLQHAGARHAVWLEGGSASFSISQPGTPEPFAVLAGDVVVRVAASQFRIARTIERTDLVVASGAVDVQYRGTSVHVTAGQSWSTAPPIDRAPPPRVTEPKVVPPVAPPRKHTSIVPDRQRYEALAASEVAHPDAAITGYLAMARGATAWAPLALYAAGRLAADRHEARAKDLLTLYLQRFPSGPNVDDVTYLLDRLEGASR